MKHLILPCALCLNGYWCAAQINSPAIINSAGTKSVVNNVVFEFSLGEMATTTIGNNPLITQGFLQPMSQTINAPLPVRGLELMVKRLNSQQVQLQWNTVEEIGNKGFTIERKKETENSFASLRLVPSKAAGGNSTLPLQYAQLDTNAFSGRTHYRIRQEDLNGQSSYSLIRTVDGEVSKTVLLKAWPIPAPKEFSVSLSGAEKDQLLIYDANGRLVRNLPVTENMPVKITGLLPGTYLLRLQQQKDLVQKIIVQ